MTWHYSVFLYVPILCLFFFFLNITSAGLALDPLTMVLRSCSWSRSWMLYFQMAKFFPLNLSVLMPPSLVEGFDSILI